MILGLLLLLSGCTATITVEALPSGADVYVTKNPPMSSRAPITYEARGRAPFQTVVNYWAWENFYVWADAPGHEPMVYAIPNEVKVGPAIGGFFCAPIWLWVMGPTEAPIYIDLEQGRPY